MLYPKWKNPTGSPNLLIVHRDTGRKKPGLLFPRAQNGRSANSRHLWIRNFAEPAENAGGYLE